MKSWCDLSWTEKRKIEQGKVNSLDYLTGYDFNVKAKVRESKREKEEDEQASQNPHI